MKASTGGLTGVLDSACPHCVVWGRKLSGVSEAL